MELFKSQSANPLFDKGRAFLRDWGARLADQWFSFLRKDVRDVAEKLYSDKVVLDFSRLISSKEDIDAWLIHLYDLLALYSKAEGDIAVGNNSNTGQQVNWLSDFPKREVQWLGTRVNISKWEKIYIEFCSSG